MHKTSPVVVVFAGASLLAIPTAAESGDFALFTEVRVIWGGGDGPGLGIAASPVVATRGDYISPLVGTTLGFAHRAEGGPSVDLLGHIGVGAQASPCSGHLVPEATLSAQGGARWFGGGVQPVVGAHSILASVSRVDYTRTLGETAANRWALGLGYPLGVADDGVWPNGDCPSAAKVVVGRPARAGDGRVRPARVVSAAPWRARARPWGRRAGEELAAVAAFTDLALQLEHQGAPTSMVAAVRRAAREEVAHATACLQVAARLQGAPVWASPPAGVGRRPVSLGRLAAESHADGWLNEGEAAAEAVDRSQATADPIQQAVDARIAREEAGHAALGRAIDQWAVWRGGARVRRERAAVLEALGVR